MRGLVDEIQDVLTEGTVVNKRVAEVAPDLDWLMHKYGLSYDEAKVSRRGFEIVVELPEEQEQIAEILLAELKHAAERNDFNVKGEIDRTVKVRLTAGKARR